MPKLDSALRKAVESSTTELGSGDYKPLTPGRYFGNIASIEAGSNDNAAWWNVELDEIHNSAGEKQPGRQFYRIFLPTAKPRPGQDKAKWENGNALSEARLKQLFDVTGFTPESDTDELIGTRVGAVVVIRTITKGERAGQKTNEVRSLFQAEQDYSSTGDDDF